MNAPAGRLAVPPAASSPSARQPVSSGSGTHFGEFFRYHGWLSPGVRLFRNISFRAKAIWVSLAFVIPLLMTLLFLWFTAQEQIAAGVSERQGVAYAQPLLKLVEAAQNRRRAAAAQDADLDAKQSQVVAAFAEVQARQSEFGTTMNSKPAFDTLLKAHQALLQQPLGSNGDETFVRHSAYIDVALNLLNAVADGSQLTLDPDLGTYNLMNMAVLRGPVLSENAAKLRGLGTLSLKESLKDKQLSKERRDLLVSGVSVQAFLVKDYESSFKSGLASNPDWATQFDLSAVSAALLALKAATRESLLGIAVKGDPAAYLALGDSAVQAQRALDLKLLERLDSDLQKRIVKLQTSLALQVAVAGLFVALAGYLFLAFYKVVMGGLLEVSGHLKAISRGNLTTCPQPWGQDEAAQLMMTLGEMQGSLRHVVSGVLTGSAQVRSASGEIAAASADLAQRTEQSAARLEQTASSMEEIASTVRQTADTVKEVSAIVDNNATVARQGGVVIGQVVGTMTDIRTSSAKIGEIIGVIDSIAFQTNILALNAAVEAARAGEQGRGFAVVATEVRALAGRSAAAAREIKSLINASMQQVESGNRVVANAGATMADIVAKAERIAGMMVEITTATREQSIGVGQVGEAVHALDQSIQQNAALVEQTTAAAGSLADQAQRLSDDVGFFRLK